MRRLGNILAFCSMVTFLVWVTDRQQYNSYRHHFDDAGSVSPQMSVPSNTTSTISAKREHNEIDDFVTNATSEISALRTFMESHNSSRLVGASDFVALVDEADVTHRLVASGLWRDPSIWQNGVVPANGARVHIPEDMEVHLDYISDVHLKSLRVDGVLTLSTEKSTELMVDTLVVNTTGSLHVGTADEPVQADVEALISIIGFNDASDSENDPERGSLFISMGEVKMYGQEKTSMVPLTAMSEGGTGELVLESAPENWKSGDLIVVSGSRLSRDDARPLIVDYVDGRRVGVVISDDGDEETAWLELENENGIHDNLKNFVVNISRNVAISSSLGDDHSDQLPGKVLFYGAGAVNAEISYIGGYGLGIDDQGGNIEVSEFSRPAFEFRHATSDSPSRLEGLSFVNTPTSPIEIQDGFVEVVDSVAYDADGGAWLTAYGAPSRVLWQAKRQIPGFSLLTGQ